MLPALLAFTLVFRAPAAPLQSTPAPSPPPRSAGEQAAPASPAPAPRVDRQVLWPAPTAEDWARPCLIPWQRSFEDAVAVSRETGKPILVCVNMDGEIASEHYAGIRYRQPEIAALYEPYVCVIASVDRHTPRDHDAQGRRILCPRFGSVTCGEHIAIEPGLFRRFFEGQRVAPRHIGIEPGGAEIYDVYYAWDTDSVFASIREGVANHPLPPPRFDHGDWPLARRVASRNLRDRVAVEQAYRDGDLGIRRELLEAALRHPEAAPVDLVRLGVFGSEDELRPLARRALARMTSPEAVALLGDALGEWMEAPERDALIRALETIGRTSPHARRLAAVHRGIAAARPSIDVTGWDRALAGTREGAPAGDADEAVAPEPHAGVPAASSVPAATAAREASDRLRLAEGYLEEALAMRFPGARGSSGRWRSVGEDLARLRFEDARGAALEAERLGEGGWRAGAVRALAANYLGEEDEARALAASAAAALPPGEPSWLAMATLELFAKTRWRAIARAIDEKEDWPSSWLADVHAACSVLARHPRGTDAQVAWHHDVLSWLGAGAEAGRVLDAGLVRFPDSSRLHDRLRARWLRERGAGGLLEGYESWLAGSAPAPPARDGGFERTGSPPAVRPSHLPWFTGKAAMVAAEFHRRTGDAARAREAYERAASYFEREQARHPETREVTDAAVARVLAGRARLAFEEGRDGEALDDLLASFQRCPSAAADRDGWNLSAIDTARGLRGRLEAAGQEERVARLDAALGDLDPALFDRPSFERGTPDRPAPGWRQRITHRDPVPSQGPPR